MSIVVFDTETTDLEKPFCYNVGYVIFDTITNTKVVKRDFVVEQVWHNIELFQSAYYAEKRPLYVGRLRARTATLDKWGYIMQRMRRDLKQFDVEHGFAQNAEFDERVFEYNCDWFKTMNPLDELIVHDIRGHVCEAIADTQAYKDFCDNASANKIASLVSQINLNTVGKNGIVRAKTQSELDREKRKIIEAVEAEWFTEAGNYSTTAQTIYRYLINDEDYDEEHTAMADADIECDILCACVQNGCAWNADYKKPSIVRHVPRTFVVIDKNGVSHSFDYTAKKKIPHDGGVRLYEQAPPQSVPTPTANP